MLNHIDNIMGEIGQVKSSLDQYRLIGTVLGEFCKKDQLDNLYSIESIIDHGMVIRVQDKIFPAFDEIYNFLKSKNHNAENQFAYHNSTAFFDCVKQDKYKCFDSNVDTLRVIVLGSCYHERHKYIIIDKFNIISRQLYIREVRHPKNSAPDVMTFDMFKERKYELHFSDCKDFKPTTYGDTRDPGHVLTYTSNIDFHDTDMIVDVRYHDVSSAECDGSIFYMSKLYDIFLEISSLLTYVEE